MTDAEYQKVLRYRAWGHQACYLAACALRDQVPQLDAGWDMDGLYKFCKFHSITAICTMALDSAWKQTPGDPHIMTQWRQARDKAIRKNILLNAERQRILAHLEATGCWYMPLKGSLLQFDYPQFGMRQMGDNDILVDPEHMSRIREFMLSGGYTCETYNQGNHDEYTRPPVYNFEIHRALFKPQTAPELAAYYGDIHSRSIKDGDNEYGWHLSWEDFYIYVTVHAWRHFVVSGVGIRNLLDVYVFLGKRGDTLDWEYVEREMRKLGIWEFQLLCKRLSHQLFSRPIWEPEIPEEDVSALDAFFTSGTFGTEQQLFQKQMEAAGGRGKHFLRRLFPEPRLLSVMYPVVQGRPWLVPFVWVYRLVISVFRKPARVLREMGSIFKK